MGVCDSAEGDVNSGDEGIEDMGMKVNSNESESRGLADSDDDDDSAVEMARKEAEKKRKDLASRSKVKEASVEENVEWGATVLDAVAQAAEDDAAKAKAADAEAAKAKAADAEAAKAKAADAEAAKAKAADAEAAKAKAADAEAAKTEAAEQAAGEVPSVLLVFDMDETMIGLSSDLVHRFTLGPNMGPKVAPTTDELAEAMRQGLLRPGLKEALEYLVQTLHLPLVVYTKAKEDWATEILKAMEQVVGFRFIIEDGLFHFDDCDKKVKDPSDPNSKAQKYQKSLAFVVDSLKQRDGSTYDWLSLDKILMFDDLNSVPPFEAQQLVHVHPYRWAAICSDFVGTIEEATDTKLEDFPEQLLDFLNEEWIYAPKDKEPEKHELYEACRALIRDEMNSKAQADDSLWGDVLSLFQNTSISALNAAVLREKISPQMVHGKRSDQKDKVITLFNDEPVESVCKVLKADRAHIEHVISVQIEGNQAAIVQVCQKGRVVSHHACWPGAAPVEVFKLQYYVSEVHAFPKLGKFELLAWSPFSPEEGSETRGKRFQIEEDEGSDTPATREQLQAFTDMLDADGDGFISKEEMDAWAYRKDGRRRDGVLPSEDELEEFQQIVAAADKNADGKMSKEEFVDFILKIELPMSALQCLS